MSFTSNYSILFTTKNLNIYKSIFIFLFLLISVYVSIKSGERIAFLQYYLLILTYIFLKNKKFKLFVLISAIIFTFSFFILDKGIQKICSFL